MSNLLELAHPANPDMGRAKHADYSWTGGQHHLHGGACVLLSHGDRGGECGQSFYRLKPPNYVPFSGMEGTRNSIEKSRDLNLGGRFCKLKPPHMGQFIYFLNPQSLLVNSAYI